MRTKLLLLLASFFTCCTVQAAPFLVSDPYPTAATQPDSFQCKFDGSVTPVSSPSVIVAPATTKQLHLDIAPLALASGNHTVQCQALSASAGVTPSAYTAIVTFLVGVLAPPTNLRVCCVTP